MKLFMAQFPIQELPQPISIIKAEIFPIEEESSLELPSTQGDLFVAQDSLPSLAEDMSDPQIQAS